MIEKNLYLSTAIPITDISSRMFFFEENQPSISFGIHKVYAPITKVPIIMKGLTKNTISVSSFASTIIKLGPSHYRLYSTNYPFSFKTMYIALWESGDGIIWYPLKVSRHGKFSSNSICINGIPGNQDMIGQPQVLHLADNVWYMYFWKHKEGHCRYLRAESRDGLNWAVVDFDNPVLYHPNDQGLYAWAMGTSLRKIKNLQITRKEAEKHLKLISNDATYVYYNEYLKRFECYSVWLHPEVRERSRYKGEAGKPKGIIRFIHKRVSSDGINWSYPEVILLPDYRDPWDLQFYYLSVQWHDKWLIGNLGYYRTEEGQDTTDMDLCFSKDGQSWHRPVRGGFIPRVENKPDAMGIYAPNTWIDKGNKWLCLYTGTPDPHDEDIHRASIMGATFDKNRFVGLQAGKVTGGFLSDVFILQNANIKVDACIKGWMRAEICDAFGNAIKDFHLMDSYVISGDKSEHILRWKQSDTKDLKYRALRLRIEFREGVIYSFCF